MREVLLERKQRQRGIGAERFGTGYVNAAVDAFQLLHGSCAQRGCFIDFLLYEQSLNFQLVHVDNAYFAVSESFVVGVEKAVEIVEHTLVELYEIVVAHNVDAK